MTQAGSQTDKTKNCILRQQNPAIIAQSSEQTHTQMCSTVRTSVPAQTCTYVPACWMSALCAMHQQLARVTVHRRIAFRLYWPH